MSFASTKSKRRLTGALAILISAFLGAALVTAQPAAAAKGGKSGRTNGSLSAMVGTPDGKHQLTFNINGDWIENGSLYVNVIEAEFCGKTPARTGPSSSPKGQLPYAVAAFTRR